MFFPSIAPSHPTTAGKHQWFLNLATLHVVVHNPDVKPNVIFALSSGFQMSVKSNHANSVVLVGFLIGSDKT